MSHAVQRKPAVEPGYPSAPPRNPWAKLPIERIIEIATKGGTAVYLQRGQRYMQEIGRRGGQNGRGAVKIHRQPRPRKWWRFS